MLICIVFYFKTFDDSLDIYFNKKGEELMKQYYYEIKEGIILIDLKYNIFHQNLAALDMFGQ